MAAQKINLWVKHLLDKVVSFVLLVALSPLLLFIALAIKTEDGGPVFFRQPRLGRNGSQFLIWKFRTMIVDADKYLDEMGRPTQNRITLVGRFLRYLSLDELPQLINIFKGEMSVVGPRPALTSHLPRYTDVQKKRLQMRPGVTGLAQVNGRNTLRWSKRLEFDCWYVEHYSLWLDLKILAKTVKVVLFREGIVVDRNPDQVDDLTRLGDSQNGNGR